MVKKVSLDTTFPTALSGDMIPVRRVNSDNTISYGNVSAVALMSSSGGLVEYDTFADLPDPSSLSNGVVAHVKTATGIRFMANRKPIGFYTVVGGAWIIGTNRNESLDDLDVRTSSNLTAITALQGDSFIEVGDQVVTADYRYNASNLSSDGSVWKVARYDRNNDLTETTADNTNNSGVTYTNALANIATLTYG